VCAEFDVPLHRTVNIWVISTLGLLGIMLLSYICVDMFLCQCVFSFLLLQPPWWVCSGSHLHLLGGWWCWISFTCSVTYVSWASCVVGMVTYTHTPYLWVTPLHPSVLGLNGWALIL
jgi:hypothetical protein